MINTIPSASINNRKIILEIRFKAKPILLDKRGEILNKILEKNVIPNSHWELGNSEIKLRDKEDIEESRTSILVDPGRITLVSTNVSSNENFYHSVDKIYKSLKEIVGDFDILRIGCRILGTYKTKSKDFKDVMNGFTKMFPNQILLEEFPVKDLRFQIIYQNGMYHIGPISKNDNFIAREFKYNDCIKGVGFAIDTDNYILKDETSEKINEISIRDVFMASISVEKSLFDKLSTL